MQNKYVGDIGDFGKFGLLKVLCQQDNEAENLSLGVVWYLIPDEPHNNDGRFIHYLDHTGRNRRRFRNCDSDLYDQLSRIVNDRDRRVSRISEDGVLPVGTVYYDQVLSYQLLPAGNDRLNLRNEWVQRALDETIECNIIFVDPDNGLEVSSVERHHCRGPKYVFYDELSSYIERGQSLVIYQHMNMSKSAEKQVQERISQIKECLDVSEGVFALLYRRGTARAFVVVPAERHRMLLLNKSNQLLSGPWGQHFSFI